jgi:hypothetical protein
MERSFLFLQSLLHVDLPAGIRLLEQSPLLLDILSLNVLALLLLLIV